jgi:hypothetical protein
MLIGADEILISSWVLRGSGIEQEARARLDVLGLGRDSLSFCSQVHSFSHYTAPNRKQNTSIMEKSYKYIWTIFYVNSQLMTKAG